MEGKVAIVTGGASGIGKAYTEILLEHNIKVCVVDVNADLGEKTVKEFRQKFREDQVLFIHCDVTSDEQLEGTFKEAITKFGKLDIVVNNAGIVDETGWKRMIAINLAAVLQGSYLGIKYMGTDNGGRGGVIINTSSMAGLFPIDYIPSYTASKYGIVGYTRSMGMISHELHGIRMNAVCPAFVNSPLHVGLVKEGILYGPDALTKAAALQKNIGTISTREVAEGFWKLLEDDTLSGQCMLIGPEGALITHKLPDNYHDTLTMFTDYKA